MHWACIINYGGSCVEHLPLIYIHHSSICLEPFEALYGRRSRSPIGWFEIGEVEMFGPDLVYQVMEIVKMI